MPPLPLDRLLKLTPDGILFAIKVSPRSHRNLIKGVVELPHDRIGFAIQVCQPATDGAANEAVICLIAELFKVPRSSVRIKSGFKSRVKMIEIEGPPLILQKRLSDAGSINFPDSNR